ncbi:MAG: hypothetical protein JXB10_03115 [Pirellulales bacterium]|nr:hypothetical protein [Pirellulales bacterium]
MKKLKISAEEKSLLKNLLRDCPPRDALPYTDEFKELKQQYFETTQRELDNSEFWRLISNVAKEGGIGKKGPRRPRITSPKLTIPQQLEILRLFPDGIGGRDRLPYTKEFDDVHKRFNKRTGLKLTPHDFWLSVSSVAKKSRPPKPLFESAPRGELPRAIAHSGQFGLARQGRIR